MNKNPIYLILGANGVIGTSLNNWLIERASSYRIFSFNRDQLDVTDEKAIRQVMDFVKPTHLFNCSGLSSFEFCEEMNDIAFQLNAYCPEIISIICKEFNTKLVHFSTGHLFNDSLRSNYLENDIPNPFFSYSKSKFLGEQLINKRCANNIIIRLGQIFSSNGINLLTSSLAKTNKKINIPICEDYLFSPTYLDDAIGITFNLINTNKIGTYNCCNSGTTNG